MQSACVGSLQLTEFNSWSAKEYDCRSTTPLYISVSATYEDNDMLRLISQREAHSSEHTGNVVTLAAISGLS